MTRPIFTALHLKSGVAAAGQLRHAVILWRNGDLFGAAYRPDQYPEQAALEYLRQSVPIDCPASPDDWQEGDTVLYMGEINTTPAELRNLVKQGHETDTNRVKARAYLDAKGR